MDFFKARHTYDNDEYYNKSSNNNNNNKRSKKEHDNNNNNNNLIHVDSKQRRNNISQSKIPDILIQNLSYEKDRIEKENNNNNNNNDKHKPTDGDIQSLILRNEYFMGIKLGWPFPVLLQPQRLMCMHIIKGLKDCKHVVIESPTGTGKSAAILCSVLAWQRDHYNNNNNKENVKIIYCSRTHSQVAQMVSSLQKTPYRPKMTVLGSRDRLCIHKHIINRKKKSNINNECRERVKATEKMRTKYNKYDGDLDPPYWFETDELEHSIVNNNNNDDITDDEEDQNNNSSSSSRYQKKPTCPHYRQLSATRTAYNMKENFWPKCNNNNNNNYYYIGNESTKDGTHDIEDLIQFGKNPYKRTVVIIQQRQKQHHDNNENTTCWGISIQYNIDIDNNYPIVTKIDPDGPVYNSACVKVNDRIFCINGISTKNKNDTELDDMIINTVNDNKLVLQIGNSGNNDIHNHTSCPYYITRSLQKYADIIFCPYNYILDPNIRDALNINLTNTVVVLDEAHNVEDTLRDSGSGTWNEIDIASMIDGLQYYSNADIKYVGYADIKNNNNNSKNNNNNNNNNTEGDGSDKTKVPINQIAHELLTFLENIFLFLYDQKHIFEKNGGAKKALVEWERFHTPDTKTFETGYDGPTGCGYRNEQIIGCINFFEKINIQTNKGITLRQYAIAMLEHIQNKDDGAPLVSIEMNRFEQLNDFINKVTSAMDNPKHYYIQTTVQPNTSFQYASGYIISSNSYHHNQKQQQQQPKSLPKQSEKIKSCNFCNNNINYGHDLVYHDGTIVHGSYNNGMKPPWLSNLIIELLSPALFMEDLTRECRSVILASGSLAPLPSLCAELGLQAAVAPISNEQKHNNNKNPPQSKKLNNESINDVITNFVSQELKVVEEVEEEKSIARLQDRPPPLEANHVIDLDKQLFAVSIGHFPTGEKLTVNYENYKRDDFIEKLGYAIAEVIDCIERGGILVFLPSYTLLKKCTKIWNPSSSSSTGNNRRSTSFQVDNVWDRLLNSKGKVIIEPTGSQADFEAARDEYAETIQNTGNCILLAVFRGKMSEGISFNDDNARGVICVGIPYPSSFERSVKAKKDYNNELIKFDKRHDVLDGNSWYSQQAFRAVSQALGRCIRHAGDYGTVVLMDSRHCDDSPSYQNGTCYAHRQLPKWMRHHVRSLVPYTIHEYNNKLIGGGWPELRRVMKKFFQNAPSHCEDVLRKQQEQLLAAQKRALLKTPTKSTAAACEDSSA